MQLFCQGKLFYSTGAAPREKKGIINFNYMIREGMWLPPCTSVLKKWPFILPQVPQIAFRIDKETLRDAVMIRLRVLHPLHAFFPDLVQYGIGNPH